MKQLIFSGMALVLVAAPGIVGASCAGDGYTIRLNQTQIEDRLGGNRVLATSPGGEEWNQDHCSNFSLFKVGTTASPPKYPGRPSVDPRAYRGTWGITGTGNNALVQYNYTVGGNSGPFEWSLWSKTPGNNSGELCWEEDGSVIATAPVPLSFAEDCTPP